MHQHYTYLVDVCFLFVILQCSASFKQPPHTGFYLPMFDSLNHVHKKSPRHSETIFRIFPQSYLASSAIFT